PPLTPDVASLNPRRNDHQRAYRLCPEATLLPVISKLRLKRDGRGLERRLTERIRVKGAKLPI
ncbi:MAG: hypothetical protein KAI80_01550, partial [Hyphomicrobiaceae bacterium]|nr:hypothetical protein [Hyphomicrobiaceae bacterium]